MGDRLSVEVVYALPEQQVVVALRVETGTTVRQLIEQSRIRERFPDIDLTRNRVGVFGRPCGLDEAVRAGDRVEIYRLLHADPKEIRRRRAAEARKR